MVARKRLFAGSRLRQLRERKGLRQAELARRMEISAAYLSQLEHDDRPLTPRLLERVAQLFPLDWQDLETDKADRLMLELREALADPMFGEALPADMLARLATQQPAFAERFALLHRAYRQTSQRLEMVDEAISNDNPRGRRLAWEEVRDWFHLSNNYIDELDRSAEELAMAISGEGGPLNLAMLERHLAQSHGVTLAASDSPFLRDFDAGERVLQIDTGQPHTGRQFQLAYQIASLCFRDMIEAVAEGADIGSQTARDLLRVGLANYAAGALLMPYRIFREAARTCRHDIDRLCKTFGTSFEQTCHRLSTLQRQGARGLPFFFCRVDMAGNITKRHSATRLQFARFGGACPLWIVHEAVAIPDRILIQLAETPDGARYVSMAKGLVKPSGSFDRIPRRYAVALGCEVEFAGDFIYADGLDLVSGRAATPIGVSCRICPRGDCDHRAHPPSDQVIAIDPNRRGVVPYALRTSLDR